MPPPACLASQQPAPAPLAQSTTRLPPPQLPAVKRSADSAPMPSLGFLKKKRTKDSQGSNSDFTPKSPVEGDGGNLKPVLSNKSAFTGEPEPATPTSAGGMNAAGGGQLQGQNASSNTQNVPSIKNLINQPNYSGSQHDSAYSSNNGTSNDHSVPEINLPSAKPTSNAMRETKGKYTLTDFTLQRTLGTGSFGRVHLVQSKHNQRFYAVKVLKKAQVVKMKQVEHTNDERRMLQRCRHPFLITLWGTWSDAKNLYMVMDFIEGGELFSLLRKSQVWRKMFGKARFNKTDLSFHSVSRTQSPSSTQPRSP